MKKRAPAKRSPLGEWMDRSGINPRSFASLLTIKRGGAKVHPSNVSQWANSRQDPSDSTIAAIERATGETVRREQWECWQRRRQRDEAKQLKQGGRS